MMGPTLQEDRSQPSKMIQPPGPCRDCFFITVPEGRGGALTRVEICVAYTCEIGKIPPDTILRGLGNFLRQYQHANVPKGEILY